ncbi:Bug family tripartite tricarboxylate transporter substrate binding protein [Cupriavidus oxalaticus]|uniref:Tripartite tricarboxylate transporter substrate binding protein n=1 Tax=Cupriavidus oxalaticus TaxID=96344 RepID=A0A4P7LHB9_9BURK|nr:tripartite tricarboxylate transporter substrate binding protein [Cupriavidus oxalaticus]QBY55185.1 tripartite tricarboxylate transporter substrate binding protein [Cupriavidus oxalaticus]
MQRRDFITAIAATMLTGHVFGQPSRYPDKPIKLLVGFPAGQATDIVARLLAERLRTLGQPVVVENKAGQGGSIALAALAKSPADGYTLMLSATASLVVNPHLYKTVGYDTLRDFEPVATVADMPMLLVAHPSEPFNTVSDMTTYAKANPGRLKYSSSGNGTLSHLGMEVLKRQAGIDMLHVPYQGSTRAMTDLLAGNIDLGLDTVAVTLPHIQSKRLKPLAVSSDSRLAFLPQVPTLAEAGMAGAAFTPWLGLVAPKGTHQDIVLRLSKQVVNTVKDPAFGERLRTLGAVPRAGNSDALSAILKREFALWGKVVRDSGARVE